MSKPTELVFASVAVAKLSGQPGFRTPQTLAAEAQTQSGITPTLIVGYVERS
jgi:hypothetical protein